MNRDYIINHIDDLTAQQLFDFISQGIVTLEELRKTGYLDASKRTVISKLQTTRDREDDNAWNDLRYTESGCRKYLEQYPAGRHVTEARQQIDYFEEQRLIEQAAKQGILNNIRRNHNFYIPGPNIEFITPENEATYKNTINYFLYKGIINRNDLINCGIPDEIIVRLNNIVSPQLTLGVTPDTIPDGYTEVYFWGVRGSGKTCALAAVLSTAEKMGYLDIAQGSGYNYMLLLKNIFSNKISFLPGGTPDDVTQYLPFTLQDPKEKYARSVSLIELSGEIFQCFLKKNANIPLSDKQEPTFNSLIKFLNDGNRKIHFFFVDYDRENNPDTDGYTQADYLNAAATYFNDKKNNIFSKTTDAMYVVITKSDLMPCSKEERIGEVSEYLKSHNFTAFVNSLRNKCRENSINGKRILGMPFSLGKVYLKQMCLFEEESSRNIIDILMRRIAPKKQSILDVFNK